MFVINAGMGVAVEFHRYQNGRWRLTAVKDAERREIFRSASTEDTLWATNLLISEPENNETSAKRYANKFKRNFKSLKNKHVQKNVLAGGANPPPQG